MPGYNRNGPMGMGPMTGRGMGLCSEQKRFAPGFFGISGNGRRRGLFRRGGRQQEGHGAWGAARVETETGGDASPVWPQINALKNQVSALKRELEILKGRFSGPVE